MQRNEKVILIRDVPAAIFEVLDGVMTTQGLLRQITREIEEDFTPYLNDPEGLLVFVASQPKDDWTAIFSSLTLDDEWMLVEALAVSLEQPTTYALLYDDVARYGYRYFADGVLQEEFLPSTDDDQQLDAEALFSRLTTHGIPLELIDDRALSFGEQHILVAYGAVRAESTNMHDHQPTA